MYFLFTFYYKNIYIRSHHFEVYLENRHSGDLKNSWTLLKILKRIRILAWGYTKKWTSWNWNEVLLPGFRTPISTHLTTAASIKWIVLQRQVDITIYFCFQHAAFLLTIKQKIPAKFYQRTFNTGNFSTWSLHTTFRIDDIKIQVYHHQTKCYSIKTKKEKCKYCNKWNIVKQIISFYYFI